MSKNWFDVDRRGLAKLLGTRGLAFIVLELLQNAWDQVVTQVTITLSSAGRGLVRVEVADDDPAGFKDLSHAFTLFAHTDKRTNPEQRGRFNVGEKLLLAMCKEARIETTKGSVFFDAKGRHTGRRRTKSGSVVTCTLRMTKKDVEEFRVLLRTVLPPEGIRTTVDIMGEQFKLEHREPQTAFVETLPTVLADGDGTMRPTRRKTTVEIHVPRFDEVGILYEMGLPVVETGDKFHYNVAQKIPLTMERDNVSPAFLKTLRVLALNHCHDDLEEQEATSSWVREAASDKRCDVEATSTVTSLRFGNKVVSYDPSDVEANKRAVSRGYNVVHGSQLSKEEWANVRNAGVMKPAGQVTPTPKPFHPDGDDLRVVAPADYSLRQQRIADYLKRMGEKLIDKEITVVLADDPRWWPAGCYGGRRLIINLAKYRNVDVGDVDLDSFLIHEMTHEYVADHLSKEMLDTACELGAKLAAICRNEHSGESQHKQKSQGGN